MIRKNLLGCLIAGSMTVAAPCAMGADFYAGKTIRITTGNDPGGGHDLHSRIISNHLARFVAGQPNVVVQNMPGAGGLTAVNYVYNVANKDGTDVGLFNRDILLQPLLGQTSARFEIDKFNWIGTPASYADDAYLILVRSSLGYKTMQDVRKASPPLNIAHHGTPLIPLVKEGLGASAKIITGYRGSNEAVVAFQRNEVDGIGASYVNLTRRFPDWVKNDVVRIIVQYGHEKRLPGLPDVPTARELAQTPDDLDLIKLTELPLTLGFPLAAPPGVPAENVKILREAFMTMLQDPQYRADLAKAGLEYSPRSGELLLGDIREIMSVKPNVIARYKTLVN
jgi:tripartite-type tricarboxylate transporter receptor subunit TctC